MQCVHLIRNHRQDNLLDRIKKIGIDVVLTIRLSKYNEKILHVRTLHIVPKLLIE